MAIDRGTVAELSQRPDAVPRLLNLLIDEATVRWDDLRFPATAVNPPGAAADPDRDTGDGTLLFDASGTEVVFFVAQLPHAWAIATELRPHVHWCKTTSASGTVSWQLRYKWAGIGDTFGAWSTAAEATLVVSDSDTADKHAYSTFAGITPAADGVSSILLIELARVGSADTYGADAKLLEFDIHYQIDARGSREEAVK